MFCCEVFDELKKEFINNNNSHSYIFYTNDFFSCKKDINELLKYIFNTTNLPENCSDYLVIEKSEKKSILRDEVENIMEFFKNTSYFNKYRVYLIEEAHKLTSTTANMILKFLEEPNKDVIALFITNNLDAVLNTIKSRCQIINAFYNNDIKSELTEDEEKVLTLLFKEDKYETLIKIKKELDNYDRDKLIIMLKNILDYMSKDFLNNINNVKIINKAISMLNSNVNTDYVFDYILLERNN